MLDAIGDFPQEKNSDITNAVRRVYGGGSDWKATLRETLGLGDGLDDNLRQMWLRNQQTAQTAGHTLSPEAFARMVVDQNFAGLIGIGGTTVSNENKITTSRFSNSASERLYLGKWPDEPHCRQQYERGGQCGGCSFFAKFDADYGLCCHSDSRHFTETVFEHFTCPTFVHEG